jgi:hypothetical protein
MEKVTILNHKGNEATNLQVWTAEIYKAVMPILEQFDESEAIEIGGVTFDKDEKVQKRIDTIMTKFSADWFAKVGKAKVKTIVEFID